MILSFAEPANIIISEFQAWSEASEIEFWWLRGRRTLPGVFVAERNAET